MDWESATYLDFASNYAWKMLSWKLVHESRKKRNQQWMFAADYRKHIQDFWETRIVRTTWFHADKQNNKTLTEHKNFSSTAIINVSEDGLRAGSRNIRLNTKQ